MPVPDNFNAQDTTPENFNLYGSPGHLLRRAHQRSHKIFRKHVGEDLTRQQFALLIVLLQNPCCTQTQLVERAGIDKGTLREMLLRMAESGLIHRRRDTVDARLWNLSLTSMGAEITHKYMAQVVAAQGEILAPLTIDEKHELIRLLGLISNNEC